MYTTQRHGAQKTEVMTHFVNLNGLPLSTVDEIDAIFEDKLAEAYFASDSKIALINPALPAFFEQCRMHDIKVRLPHRCQVPHIPSAPHVLSRNSMGRADLLVGTHLPVATIIALCFAVRLKKGHGS
jgi:hypothetical protein